jgi:hypothetical protein
VRQFFCRQTNQRRGGKGRVSLYRQTNQRRGGKGRVSLIPHVATPRMSTF